MATKSTPFDGGTGGSRRCENAEQFVMQRLDEDTDPMTSAELAEEYGCTASHMRDAMRSLRRAGVVRRVSRGEYERVPTYAGAAQTAAAGDDQSEDTEDAAGGGRVPDAKDIAPIGDALSKQRELAQGNEGQSEEEAEEIEEQPEPVGVPVPIAPKYLLASSAALFAVIALVQLSRSGADQNQSERREDRQDRVF